MAGPRVFAAEVQRNFTSRKRVTILVSRFHREIAQSLVDAATETLRRARVRLSDITIYPVPGAYELPMVAAKCLKGSPKPDAIIALGTLVKGQTVQYEVLAQSVMDALMQLAIQAAVPISCGVIVASSVAQAQDRAGGSQGNRGVEAALAAIEMIQLYETIAPKRRGK